ncbi:hypothetical protein ANO11243_091600 [Dothideomycetidae sp. 11243]|nr:hypothetical protein ANO11243_091600 [fungal sp. No.11243]
MHWVVPERDYLPPYPVDFNNTWAKLRWATTVVFSTRGMGWSHELKCVRPLQLRAARLSRIRYTFSSILSLVFFVALVDVQTAWRESVLRDWTAEAPTGITHLPWRLQLPLLWSHAAVSFAGIAGAYTAAAIPMVGLGFFDPVDFPGLFGDLRDAYTVRRPWNRVWHQNLRHILISGSNTLLAALRISNHTTAANTIKVFTAFALSGLLHALAAALACRHDTGDFSFFISQAVAIVLEETIMFVGRSILSTGAQSSGKSQERNAESASPESSRQQKATPKWYWRAVGFAWVVVWFTFSVRRYLDKQVRAGLYAPESGHVPLSARWIK